MIVVPAISIDSGANVEDKMNIGDGRESRKTSLTVLIDERVTPH